MKKFLCLAIKLTLVKFEYKLLKIFSFLALIFAYATIIFYASNPTEGFSGQLTNSFVQFQFFAAGILLSGYLKGWQPEWNILTRISQFVIGIVCWLLASMVCEVNADAPHLATIPQSVSGWLLILIGVMLMFFSLYGASAKKVPVSLAYLGRISYGMYVFHITIYWLVYKIFKDELAVFSERIGLLDFKNDVGAVIAFICTVLIAMLSYIFFEKPFLRLKARFTLIPSRD